jgi:hypothetical protein
VACFPFFLFSFLLIINSQSQSQSRAESRTPKQTLSCTISDLSYSELKPVLQESEDLKEGVDGSKIEMAQLRTEIRLSEARCRDLEERLAQKDSEFDSLEEIFESKLAPLQADHSLIPPSDKCITPPFPMRPRDFPGEGVAELRERVMHLESQLLQVRASTTQRRKFTHSGKSSSQQ